MFVEMLLKCLCGGAGLTCSTHLSTKGSDILPNFSFDNMPCYMESNVRWAEPKIFSLVDQYHSLASYRLFFSGNDGDPENVTQYQKRQVFFFFKNAYVLKSYCL